MSELMLEKLKQEKSMSNSIDGGPTNALFIEQKAANIEKQK